MTHLSDQERRLVQLFGQGPTQAPSHQSVHRAFEEQAAAHPEAVAAEHRGDALTYRELDRQANRLATHLIALGVKPGDRVGLFVRRSLPMLVGLLATLKAGAAYVPQDAALTPRAQLEHVVHTAGITVVLTQSAYEKRIPLPEGGVLIAVDQFTAHQGRDADAGPPAPAIPSNPEHPCYVLFTSGTTGTPNGVAVTHGNVTNLLLTSPGDLGIRPGWRVGQILNIAFDMAAWEILASLSHGATLLIRGEDIAETAARVDVLIATPTVLGSLDPAACRRIRVVAVAGEPCPRPLADRWARTCTFYNGCGPTETTIVNTMQRHDPSAVRLTIGRPTPNNTVYVLDENGRACPPGQVGEMWAGGACVSAGYLGDPHLTETRYAPDPFLGGTRKMFRTRDLGRWTPDGQLEHLGRTDDQVKVRGFRVELDSVSAVLERIPGCERAVTLKLDERTLVSFVSPLDVRPESARRAVAEALPYYCVPAVVHPLAELPETNRGKVDKAALRRLLTQGAAA
ncbi:amino acid adenylation domain-containing protein [Streptomyces sp. NPDC006879]|uniref:amino acid adenylation domain-containing protein n=1 Tax=Streptomyces sp. NPDC006879 TaxID=3364767 RepID=UPI0036B67C80